MSADEDEDIGEFFDQIERLVHEAMKPYRTYYAKVAKVKDKDCKAGGVYVEVPELGAFKMPKDSAYEGDLMYVPVLTPWRGTIWPKVGDEGYVFFLGIGFTEPRFVLDGHDLFVENKTEQEKNVLAELNEGSIFSHTKDKGFELKATKGNSATEPTVLGDYLKDLIDFQMDLNKFMLDKIKELYGMAKDHTHNCGTGMGGASATNGAKAAKATPIIVSKKSGVDSKKTEYAQAGKLRSKVNKIN